MGGGGGSTVSPKKKYNYPECPGSRDIESKCNKNSLDVHRSQSCWPRSQLVGYLILRFVCESFFHFLPMRGCLNCFQQRMIGRFLIRDFFVTGSGHVQCYIFPTNFGLEHLRICFSYVAYLK